MRRAQQPAPGRGRQQPLQPPLRVEIHLGRPAADEVEHLAPVGRAAELAAGGAEDHDLVAGRGEVARHPVGDALEQAHHADRGRRVDRAGRALVVEAHVPAGHRRVERAAGVGDAAAGLPELEEDFRLLGVAEVEAIGDAQRHRAGAGDVPRRLGDGRLAAFVRIERHQPVVAVHRDGEPERRARHLQHARVAAGAEHGRGLDRRVVLLVHPALAREVGRVEQQLERRLQVGFGRAARARPRDGPWPRHPRARPAGRSGSRRPDAGPEWRPRRARRAARGRSRRRSPGRSGWR